MRDKPKGFVIIFICALGFVAVWLNLLLLISPQIFSGKSNAPSYAVEQFDYWSHSRASLRFKLPEKYDVEFSEEYDFEVLVEFYRIYRKGDREQAILISLRKEDWEEPEENLGSFSGIFTEDGEKFAQLLGADVYWTKPDYLDEDFAYTLFFVDGDHLDRWGRGQGYTISGEYPGFQRAEIKEVIDNLEYAY